jgi:hypothetical protein
LLGDRIFEIFTRLKNSHFYAIFSGYNWWYDEILLTGFLGDMKPMREAFMEAGQIFEREVISIPVGEHGSYRQLLRYRIHAHPDKRGYGYKRARYYTFRMSGGVMESLYTLNKIIRLRPYKPNLGTIEDPRLRQRVEDYIRDRFETYEFAQLDMDYLFYVLTFFRDLPHKPKLPMVRNHRYFELGELLSGKKMVTPLITT